MSATCPICERTPATSAHDTTATVCRRQWPGGFAAEVECYRVGRLLQKDRAVLAEHTAAANQRFYEAALEKLDEAHSKLRVVEADAAALRAAFGHGPTESAWVLLSRFTSYGLAHCSVGALTDAINGILEARGVALASDAGTALLAEVARLRRVKAAAKAVFATMSRDSDGQWMWTSLDVPHALDALVEALKEASDA